MINFQMLEKILQMDFSQMRGKPVEEGMAASDEVMIEFVSDLNHFFAQFSARPSDEHLVIYSTYFKLILEKMNESEYQFFLKNYTTKYGQDTSPSQIESMARAGCIRSIAGIPIRMQYWARSNEWGGAIINSQEHRKAVRCLEQWSDWLTSRTPLFFSGATSLKTEAASANESLRFN